MPICPEVQFFSLFKSHHKVMILIEGGVGGIPYDTVFELIYILKGVNRYPGRCVAAKGVPV